MNINLLTSRNLRKAIALLERKESLHATVAELEAQLSNLFEVAPVAPVSGNPAPRLPRHGRRGQVTAAVVGLLQKAGRNGLTRKEICATLGMNANRLNAWLHRARKAMRQIQRISPGHYAWLD